MLFNSYEFIFLFLPITLIGFFLLGSKSSYRHAILWLVFASLCFYGWWNPPYLVLIVSSIVCNYAIGFFLGDRAHVPVLGRKGLLIFGLALNLGLLGYFKYANFFADNVNQFLGASVRLDPVILPLAISFFTFQQIAYLVDAYRRETQEYSFLKYSLFVTFFPQLIAGPIVHHNEVLPQFSRRSLYPIKLENVAVGLTIFSFGLCKKVLFADTIAPYANPIFEAAAQGTAITLFEAWGAALAYALQLYFDFSGYSDMAIGAARLFGIKLPLNFHSPYKSIDIIDFWRRWHITLSRFLKEYLYIPLGGNRQGQGRRHLNLMLTMLLGGLWHGAGWTFVIWGGMHGAYLVVNHQWRSLCKGLGFSNNRWSILAGQAITFLLVVVAWVMFRAENLGAAGLLYRGMLGANGIVLNVGWQGMLRPLLPMLESWNIEFLPDAVFGPQAVALLGLLLLIAWFAPNTQEWMVRYKPALNYPTQPDLAQQQPFFRRVLSWRPNTVWAIATGCLFVACVLNLSRVSEFLYFDF